MLVRSIAAASVTALLLASPTFGSRGPSSAPGGGEPRRGVVPMFGTPANGPSRQVPAQLAHSAESFPSAFAAVVLDRPALAAAAARGEVVSVELPLGAERIATVRLWAAEVSTPQIVGASIADDGSIVEAALPAPTIAILRGEVEGEAGSIVVIGLCDQFTAGLVRSQGSTYMLSSGPANSGLPTVSYEVGATPLELLQITLPPCSADQLAGYEVLEGDGGEGASGGLAGGVPCRALTMSVETDVEYLQDLFGGDTTAATNYTALLVTALSEIYRADLNTRIDMNFLRLWTAGVDVWDGGNTSEQLTEFKDLWSLVMNAQPRNLAHMLSGRSLGGGIAWLNAICSTSIGYAVSANLNGYFPYPLVDHSSQNWDIMVTAHELGHNFGAPHTHNYNPPLDGCGNSDCSQAFSGTIMSYCHTCPGGMSNISLYFHPENIVSMNNFLNSASCVAVGEPGSVAADSYASIGGVPRTIDVLANDFSPDCDAGVIATFPASTAAGATVLLSPGTGPEGRDQLVYTAPAGFVGADSFVYTASVGGGAPQAATVEFEVLALRQPDMPGDATPGLATSYYALNNPSVLPNFANLSPFASEVVPVVDFASTGGVFAGSGLSENVGAVFEGYIYVSKAEIVTLFTESDDGSRLWIGDTLVVDNDGLHGMVEREGQIALAVGGHSLRIEFFERGGGAGIIARMLDYTGVKKPIPAIRLFHGGGANTPDQNGDGIVDGADLGLLLAAWGTSGSTADLNNDLTVDGEDLGILLAAWE